MPSQTITNWVQIVTGIAMIIGLGLVIYEIRQSKQFVYGQIVTEEMGKLNDIFIATMGEDPRAALAKASLRPGELSEEDAVTLNAYYTAVTFNWIGLNRTAEITGIERPVVDTIHSQVKLHFGSRPGRRWLKSWLERGHWPKVIVEAARDALAELPANDDYMKKQLQVLLDDETS